LKPPAFIQIDLDGVWAIRKCYRLPEDNYFEKDPVYEEGLPCFLDLFKRRNIRASFFVIGRDVQVASKGARIIETIQHGHEIGNHSNNHTLGLTKLSSEEIREDIKEAQDTIIDLMESSGIDNEHYPVGFRSPGYDTDHRVLQILSELGFKYDTSLFPTYWGFIMRWLDIYISGRLPGKKRQYGSIGDGFKPVTPHPVKGLSSLYEIPVSVSVMMRLPFHFGITVSRGYDYFRRSVEGYKKRQIPLLYLFHGIDLVETRNLVLVPSKRGAGFFQKPLKEKIELAEKIIDYIDDNFEIQLARDWLASHPPVPS
jgi:peptidoglycan/xylan/chitin deacetylase (PgdA/CDA1 family)